MSESSILREAHALVHGPRNQEYSHPLDDFSCTGRMWGAILGLPGPVSPEQVALCMVALKLSRESRKHKRDNCVDGAGYWECCQMVHEEREERLDR